MKKGMKVIAFMLAAAVLLLVPDSSVLSVKAEEPTTYAVQYIGGEIRQWRFLPGSTFDETQAHMGAVILPSLLKDGDSVVIYNGADGAGPELDLGTVKLGNLTVYQNATAIVYTGGVKDCYVLAGSYCAINGEVTNAHIYDSATCTFNNNVLDLTLYAAGDLHSSLSCAGTVGRFCIRSTVDDSVQKVFYSITQGAFWIDKGSLQIPYEKYSDEPSEEYTKAMENASNPVVPAENPPAESAPSAPPADEYDHVPKTGDSAPHLWLFCASAVCLAGSLILRRSKKQ